MRTRIQTNRLILRLPQLWDAGQLCTLLKNPNITRMTTRIPVTVFKLGMEFWIMQEQANWHRKISYNYIIEIDGKPAGVCGIFNNGGNGYEIGYWIGRPYSGQGLISEAAHSVLHEGFDCLGTDFIDAGYYDDNPASGRVLEKLGFENKNQDSYLYSVARNRCARGIELRLTRKTFMNGNNSAPSKRQDQTKARTAS